MYKALTHFCAKNRTNFGKDFFWSSPDYGPKTKLILSEDRTKFE